MIEEYIQGESLETFVSHQKSISEELIVKLGIQLCDIFTYLHHLSPYPILYQDLSLIQIFKKVVFPEPVPPEMKIL